MNLMQNNNKMKLKLIGLFLFPLLAHSTDLLCRDDSGNPLTRGPFAIPNNCNAYYQCYGGILATIPCLSGRLFDESSGRCATVANVPECYLRSETVCERQSETITCPEGNAIAVKFGIYGRQDGTTCGNSKTTYCNAKNSFQILKNACDGQRSCQLRAYNEVFGDPCKGVEKYIQIRYYCRPVKQLSTYRKTVICEHGSSSTQTISCPTGQVLSIRTGFYGRYEMNVCPATNIRTTTCMARNSLNTLQAACNGKSNCSLAANNNRFGDPCSGTQKYLEAVYTCLPSDLRTVDTCERNNLTISCPRDQVVNVRRAFYGRTERLTCFSSNIINQSCNSRDVTALLRSTCDTQRSCSIQATNENFSDPCRGQRKYLRVTYQCQ